MNGCKIFESTLCFSIGRTRPSIPLVLVAWHCTGSKALPMSSCMQIISKIAMTPILQAIPTDSNPHPCPLPRQHCQICCNMPAIIALKNTNESEKQTCTTNLGQFHCLRHGVGHTNGNAAQRQLVPTFEIYFEPKRHTVDGSIDFKSWEC